jgi:hypothetical protein
MPYLASWRLALALGALPRLASSHLALACRLVPFLVLPCPGRLKKVEL